MLKIVEMINLQSHTHTVMEFPPTGIITFIGGNSDGKSVFTKVLRKVVSGEIRQPAARNGIVNWGSPYGELHLTRYDGIELTVHITLESAGNYIIYEDPSKNEKYTRTFKDRGYEDLVRIFGLHYSAERGVSLNIYSTFDALLFINTSPAVNDTLFAECLTDPKIETSLQRYKDFKGVVETKMGQVYQEQSELRIRLDSLVVYDIERETNYKARFEYCREAIIAFTRTQKEITELPYYKPLPDVDLESIAALQKCLLAAPSVPVMKMQPSYDKESARALYSLLASVPPVTPTHPKPAIDENIEKLTKVTSYYMNASLLEYAVSWEKAKMELQEIKDKRCPYCQRSFLL